MAQFIKLKLIAKDKNGNPLEEIVNVTNIVRISDEEDYIFVELCNEHGRQRKPNMRTGIFVAETINEIYEKLSEK